MKGKVMAVPCVELRDETVKFHVRILVLLYESLRVVDVVVG